MTIIQYMLHRLESKQPVAIWYQVDNDLVFLTTNNGLAQRIIQRTGARFYLIREAEPYIYMFRFDAEGDDVSPIANLTRRSRKKREKQNELGSTESANDNETD